ncbi:uncharacterized protein involved in exopolysaccharide biosynthesis [Rhodopseudomonas faecalis]|uniref:Uncharacterized protein involved in exopolysaccharide biosynthesis n=1 Tax=Rhodopseudomonas faecalis TaxID=99655 RepID=A0A318TIZ9_9BRAD|nr:lipopolysaccharide biosynthesis protein [Rhodopseudomonas faecalis]PYF03867.1 uncharacterized protein involved in exopolysaccharide biosynthesis [Rhodopseudomonas faecalis]
MRLAFWRKGGGVPVGEAATADPTADNDAEAPSGRQAAAILRQKKWRVLAPTALALLLSLAIVSLMAPRYQSTLQLSSERPSAVRQQLLKSRDIAREVIDSAKLMERPEFDPVRGQPSALKSLASLAGLAKDPLVQTPEQRVLAAYFDRLTVEADDAARTLVVGFQSSDPNLAEEVVEAIAEHAEVLEETLRQQQASADAQRRTGAIDQQRKRLAEAEARVAQLRALSVDGDGAANLNTELIKARAQKSEAEAKARLLQDALQSGRPIDVAALDAEPMRRLTERRAALRGELAQQSLTLLDGHPRIKELKAQLAELDRQLRAEATRQAQSLEVEARLAAERIDSLTANLEQLARQPSPASDKSQLAAAERELNAQRVKLESEQAAGRATAEPEATDAEAADQQMVSTTPVAPRKLPIVLAATLATMLLSAGVTVARHRPRPAAPSEADDGADEDVGEQGTAMEPEPLTPPVETAIEVPADPVPAFTAAVPDTHPALAAAVGDLEALAAELSKAGRAARKLTFLGARQPGGATMTALTLARLLSRSAKVVLIDLAPSSLALRAISTDPAAPGLAELLLKQASFGDIINRDRFSQLHLVTTGHGGADRALLRSPELNLVLDALLRVYDHVLLDASAATDLSAGLLSAQAHAIVLPEPDMTAHEQAQRRAQLMAVGFSDVTMLGSPPPLAVPAAA